MNGETLEVIDNLVHSPVAYDIANERLEIKKKSRTKETNYYVVKKIRTCLKNVCAKDIEKYGYLL